MIVDDDLDTIKFFKVSLEDNGFYVDTYIDPTKALSRFKPNFYDLSIIDTRMPELNGFELFELIRELDPKIKVCFMSTFQVYFQAMMEEHPTLDVSCFIKKPMTRNEFVNRVKCELNIS